MTDTIKPLQGWIFNHAQQSEDDEGVWEIGYLDPEDGRFFEIITVDAGNYYQPQAAEPMARAVLAMLAAKPDIDAAEPAEPVAWRSKTRINNDFDSGWHLTSTEPPQTPRTVAIEPLYAAAPPQVPQGQQGELDAQRELLRLVRVERDELAAEVYRLRGRGWAVAPPNVRANLPP